VAAGACVAGATVAGAAVGVAALHALNIMLSMTTADTTK